MKIHKAMPLLLLALSGLDCRRPDDTTGASNLLSPAVLDIGRFYGGASKRISLEFTVDGAPLSKVTYSIPKNDWIGSSFEIVQDAPLGGGNWLLVQTVNIPGKFEHTLRVQSGVREWQVPIRMELMETPNCPPSTDPCLESTFDSNLEQCTFVSTNEGQLCGNETEDICAVRHFCRQGLCTRTEIQPPAASCTPEPLGEMLVPAWEYQSANTLLFTGTTDDAGAIYFLECRTVESSVNRDCDLVSLNAEGTERWRAVNVQSRLQVTDTLHIMVIGSTVLVDAMTGDATPSRLVVLDRETGAVRQEKTTWWPSKAFVRAYGNVMAVNTGDAVRLWNFETDEELPSRLAQGEVLLPALASDGNGRLFGSAVVSDQSDPTIDPLALAFGWNVNPEGAWSAQQSLNIGATALATFEDHVLWSLPDVLRADTGALTARVQSTALQYDAVVLPDHTGLAVATRSLSGCNERLLQKFSTETGALAWRCRLANPDITSNAVSRMIALENGGAILARQRVGLSPNAFLIAVDGNGQAVLNRLLTIDLDFKRRTSPTMVGSRWIAQGIDARSKQRVIAAYDLPEQIRPATKGWITAGGRLSRDGTPQVE